MITLTNLNIFNATLELYGISTDTKPTGMFEDKYTVTNASTFYEMDTKLVYMFDKENSKWIKQ